MSERPDPVLWDSYERYCPAIVAYAKEMEAEVERLRGLNVASQEFEHAVRREIWVQAHRVAQNGYRAYRVGRGGR